MKETLELQSQQENENQTIQLQQQIVSLSKLFTLKNIFHIYI